MITHPDYVAEAIAKRIERVGPQCPHGHCWEHPGVAMVNDDGYVRCRPCMQEASRKYRSQAAKKRIILRTRGRR